MQEGKEKREFIRKIKKIIVIYTTLQGKKVTEQAITQNISEGGLQLLLVHKLEPKKLVDIEIEFIHDSIPIYATCKVTYVDPGKYKYRTGLQFVKIEDFQKERLVRYLKGEEK